MLVDNFLLNVYCIFYGQELCFFLFFGEQLSFKTIFKIRFDCFDMEEAQSFIMHIEISS